MKNGKWVPWRVVAAVIGVLSIVYMWSAKDLSAVYNAMPGEAVVPYIVTNMAVMLAKVGLMTFVIWLVRKGIDLVSRKEKTKVN